MAMPRTTSEEPFAADGAENEEGRRPTLVSAPSAASPELVDRPRRRTFTAADKLRILGEVDRATAVSPMHPDWMDWLADPAHSLSTNASRLDALVTGSRT